MTYPGSIQSYGQPAPKTPSKATASQVILGGLAAFAAFSGAATILNAVNSHNSGMIPQWQVYVAAAVCGLVLGFFIGRVAKASTLRYGRGRGIGIAFGAGIVYYLARVGIQLGVLAGIGELDWSMLGGWLVDELKYGGVLTLGMMIGAAVVGPRASASDISGPAYIGMASVPTSSSTVAGSTLAPQPPSTTGRSPYGSGGSTLPPQPPSTTGRSPYGSGGSTSSGPSTPTSPYPNNPYGQQQGR